MNRRNLIKSIALTCLSIPLFGANQKINDKNDTLPKPLKLKFGSIDLYIISDGSNLLKEPFPLIAPNQTELEFNQARKETFLDQQSIEFSYNLLLIKKNDKLILFDTGNGLSNNKNVGKLIEQLKTINVSTNQITDIIITHAHGDHINGILQPDGSFAFQNANYYISKTEYDYWLKSTQENTIKILKLISNKLTFIKANTKLFNFIKVEETPGHTPGHLAFLITDKNKSLEIKHIADVVHSPIIIRYPEYGIKFDNNFNQAVETRLKVLEEAYQKRQLLFAMHLPWPGIGYIDKKDERYQWIPLSFASNLKEIQL